MSNNKVVKNIMLPYKTTIKINNKDNNVTSLRIERLDEEQFNKVSNFYLINKNDVVKKFKFIENKISIDSFEDGTELIKFTDEKDKTKILLKVKHRLNDKHREDFIKSII